MRYAVSGPAYVPAPLEGRIEAVVSELLDVEEFTTGGAYGVDTLAAQAAIRSFPGALHRLITPSAHFNRDLAIRWHGVADRTELLEAPRGKNASESYMNRNDMLVAPEFTDCLIAFTPSDVEEQRSGTWATVRRARKSGIEIRIVPLSKLGQVA